MYCMHDTLNRTILELKLNQQLMQSVIMLTLNRTILELKYVRVFRCHALIIPLNRTILELKLRSIREVRSANSLSIAPYWN